jgi:Protein of unknown function (DUF3551)
MFKGLTVAAWFAISLFLITSSATADPFRWCAAYGTPGGTNCGFLTIEQCRATLSGNGGFCEPNQFYTGPETTRASRQRRHNQS